MSSEPHSLRGAIDRGSLLDFQSVFERLEPLATGVLDDFVNPSELQLQLDDDVGDADSARFDVVWTTQNDYNIHYSNSAGRNFRWDIHPHDYPRPSDDRHFHPPPNASNDPADVEESCISVIEIELVARATHSQWRAAYEAASVNGINDAVDPP